MEALLGLISLFASTAAAVFGLGGGLILISFLPDFLPAEQIIPVHGVTQLASNASRSAFAWRAIDWKLVPKFLVGSLAGAGLFGVVVVTISTEYIPPLIGLYILLKLWSKKTAYLLSNYESYVLLGFLQTGLGILVGSTGHLTMPRLMQELQERDRIVSTGALFMSVSHGLKLLVYGLIGFHFSQHAVLLLCMAAGALAGSWIGTFLRGKIPDGRFNVALKVLLTLLAVRMIFTAIS